MILYCTKAPLIAALTGGGSRANKRSLVVRFPLSGPVPCSGARRRDKVLDEVSAVNKFFYRSVYHNKLNDLQKDYKFRNREKS
jgi:hypothetical protein